MNINEYEEAYNKALKQLQETLKPDEQIAYTFGTGGLVPLPWSSRAIKRGNKKAIEFIKGLEGFLGVNPIDLYKTLIIFDSLGNAKRGRNLMKSKDISCGEIMPIAIPKQEVFNAKSND